MRITETEIIIRPKLTELECYTLGIAAGWYYHTALNIYEQRGGDPMDFVRLGTIVWQTYANKLNISGKYLVGFMNCFIKATKEGPDLVFSFDYDERRAVKKAFNEHVDLFNDVFVELAPNKDIFD